MKLSTRGMHAYQPGNRLQKFATRFPSPLFRIIYCSLVLSFLLPAQVDAQNAVGPNADENYSGLSYTVRYREETKTVYQITDPFAEFTIAEKVKMRPVTVKDSVIQSVNDNTVATTVYHLENSKFEDWMTIPYRTEVNADAIIMYDADGNVLYDQPHSKKYQELAGQFKEQFAASNGMIVPLFTELSQDLMNVFIDSGFVIGEDADGTISLKRDTITFLFNNASLTNEVRIAYPEGQLKYSKKDGFKINSIGQTVPSFSIVNREDLRFSDHCVHQVAIKTYPSYEIDFGKQRSVNGVVLKEDEIFVAPNPATSDITLTLPVVASNVRISISDNTGRIILEKQFNSGDDQYILDISTAGSGMYFISVDADGKMFSRSFMKN